MPNDRIDVKSLTELTTTQNPRLLIEAETEVEQGKVFYAPTDNGNDGYVYRSPSRKYIHFIQSGLLIKSDTYKKLAETIEGDSPFDNLDLERSWYMLPDSWLPLRICIDCERPVLDGETVMGLCPECYTSQRV